MNGFLQCFFLNDLTFFCEKRFDGSHGVVAVEGNGIVLLEDGLIKNFFGDESLVGLGFVFSDHGLLVFADDLLIGLPARDESIL